MMEANLDRQPQDPNIQEQLRKRLLAQQQPSPSAASPSAPTSPVPPASAPAPPTVSYPGAPAAPPVVKTPGYAPPTTPQFQAKDMRDPGVDRPTVPTQPTAPTTPSVPGAPSAAGAPGTAGSNAGDPYWFGNDANSWQPTDGSKYDLSRHGTYNTPLQYFQYLLSQGIDPKTATDYINQSFQANAGGYNFGTGAKFYPDQGSNGIIGLPDEYLSFENGQWKSTQRTAGGGGAAASQVPPNAYTQQIRDLLMKRIQGDMGPVDETTGGIGQSLSAARLEAQRTQEQERKDLAEHLYASGHGNVDQNAVTQGVQLSAERSAVGLAGIRSQLIQREYDARRSDLNDAMQQALASGDRETAYQIQLLMADLEAQLRREGMGVSLAQYQQNQNNTTVDRGGG